MLHRENMLQQTTCVTMTVDASLLCYADAGPNEEPALTGCGSVLSHI